MKIPSAEVRHRERLTAGPGRLWRHVSNVPEADVAKTGQASTRRSIGTLETCRHSLPGRTLRAGPIEGVNPPAGS